MQSAPPGMAVRPSRAREGRADLLELASVESLGGRRALLVVHLRSACSGSAPTVLLGRDGRFLGALPPGTAALLSLPGTTRSIVAVSSVEVSAPAGMSFYSDHVDVPPGPDGLLIRANRFSTRECGNGQYADVTAASKSTLEEALGDAELEWLEPRADEGQVWVDQHRRRVAELVNGPEIRPSPFIPGPSLR